MGRRGRWPRGCWGGGGIGRCWGYRVFVAETTYPVEDAASQRAHPLQWLSRRVGHVVKAPDRSAKGFEPTGGRVIPDAGQAAARFMCQDGAGSRLTLVARTGGTEGTRFRFVQDAGFAAFSWIDDGLSLVIVAGLDRPAWTGRPCWRLQKTLTGNSIPARRSRRHLVDPGGRVHRRWPCGRCPPPWL